jgi:hypothetical protein
MKRGGERRESFRGQDTSERRFQRIGKRTKLALRQLIRFMGSSATRSTLLRRERLCHERLSASSSPPRAPSGTGVAAGRRRGRAPSFVGAATRRGCAPSGAGAGELPLARARGEAVGRGASLGGRGARSGGHVASSGKKGTVGAPVDAARAAAVQARGRKGSSVRQALA